MTDQGKQIEAMKQALEQTLEMLIDNREYIEANERPEYLAMYDKAIAGAEKALAEQSAQPHMTTNLHDKMLAAIDALFSASDEIEAHIAEEQLLDVRDEINKHKRAEQPAQPLEPVQCWKCGDMDPAFHSKCDVPACGMKEGKTP